MDELKTQLKQADDAYLAGLSNKGTVKRAHKDLEQETPEVLWDESGNEVQVTFKEAVCRIRAPLGSSTCSCPSRSICRHVTAAILWVRGILEKEETAGSEAAEAVPGAASSRAVEAAPGSASFEAAPEQEPDPASAPSAALEKALLAVPLDRLKRACRNKAYREFAARAEAGELPSLSMGSVITVRFPWAEQVVKLLYPLEYSSCTCRSRELCSHKAQAILAFQIRRKAITAEMLKAREEEAGSWDQEAVLRAARSIKEGIRLQLFTGLSRLSPEAAQSMERLAVISHGAGLASFETGFRSAAAEYEQYFSRSASFCGERLLARLLSLYDRACSLEKTRDRDTFQRLAGTFRDTYEPVPRLQLTAVGSRHVKSKAGYEGEKYYFLETGQHRWYTWMDVRPTFYEGVRRRPAGRDGGQPAPWGLNCSREKMMELEFALTQAKAAQDGRLSVSRETKSEILGTRRLDRPEIREMVFWDYRALLRDLEQKEQRADQMSGPEEKSGESLALVGAARIREGTFDTIRQRFSMELFDPAGRRIQAEVNYSKEEKLTIQVLERLAKRLGEPRDAGEGNVAEEIPKGEISQGETSGRGIRDLSFLESPIWRTAGCACTRLSILNASGEICRKGGTKDRAKKRRQRRFPGIRQKAKRLARSRQRQSKPWSGFWMKWRKPWQICSGAACSLHRRNCWPGSPVWGRRAGLWDFPGRERNWRGWKQFLKKSGTSLSQIRSQPSAPGWNLWNMCGWENSARRLIWRIWSCTQNRNPFCGKGRVGGQQYEPE